jgi:hypothetical protein
VTYSIDPARSTLILRTRAGGFLSALAHDLELSGTIARGSVTREGERWDGELVVEPASIKVVGAIKRGHVDRGVLSASDVRDIEGKIVSEVFGGQAELVVRCSGTLEAPTIRVTAKRETLMNAKVSVKKDDAARVFSAKGTISIKGLGLSEVKGPLGAFVIKDDVEVEATATLIPA